MYSPSSEMSNSANPEYELSVLMIDSKEYMSFLSKSIFILQQTNLSESRLHYIHLFRSTQIVPNPPVQ